MPGLVGLITKMPASQAAPRLNKMVSCISHAPFYLTGTWCNGPLGVYVGWTAHEGSFAAQMPVKNERADVVLAFSGEEFPKPGTAKHLKEKGHLVDTDGPSCLVHLYEDDPHFVTNLNGRFHGLLIDIRQKTVLLFNDRYGMHRLYYHEDPDAFYFAAEAKAILAVRPDLRRLDSRSLGEFISCGAVLENRSLFEGIRVLPPSSAWEFESGRIQKRSTYFQPAEWENQEKLDAETYYQELRNTFTQSLSGHFAGKQKIAMSLTGGLDTRMILAGHGPEPGSLPCYTFGSMFRENQDVRVARRVAQICGQSHQVITAGDEFLSKFDDYARRAVYLTDGCVDVGRAPDLYLNEKARQIAPVRMTGNYGGEILRGVVAFKPSEPARDLFCPEFTSCVREAAETYTNISSGHPVSFAVFKQGPWYLHGILALEQTQLSMRSPYLDNEFVRTVFRAPASAVATNQISLRLVADSNQKLLDIPTDRGLGGKRDRISSTTARGALEFLFKAEYAYDMGMPQWLARVDHLLAPFRLHRLFLGRHKPFHFRVWYRDALAGYVREMLLDSLTLSRPYINKRGLESAVQGHLKGDRNYTNEIHKTLSLELLHRLFVDGPPDPPAMPTGPGH
jgi:asparagine synthase (glutamine-hydrolysing)